MSSITRRTRRSTIDIWPGFVDALATLLMVIIFVLMVFVLAQYFLGKALSGRDVTIDRLGRQLSELSEQLALEKSSSATVRLSLQTLGVELDEAKAARDQISAQLKAALDAADLQQGALAAEHKLSEDARAQAAALNQQIEALRQDLARIAAALDVSEAKARDQNVQITDLGRRLNEALASKVAELQKYRSEFFGRLRQVLGNRPGIRIEGDRFVFQSELLFATGSADLGEGGKKQLAQLATTLKDIAGQIPPGVNWVLRVDGHTDRVPINTSRFASNWELSTARAVSVVKFMAATGLPADRLAAAGFGEFQPIDRGDDPEALRKNRRIELRFDAK